MCVSQSIKQRSDLQIASVNWVAFSYYYPQFKYFQATKWNQSTSLIRTDSVSSEFSEFPRIIRCWDGDNWMYRAAKRFYLFQRNENEGRTDG